MRFLFRWFALLFRCRQRVSTRLAWKRPAPLRWQRTLQQAWLLLRAFAKLPVALVPMLVILGDGKDRDALLKLADELGIRDRLQLPGFVANPFPWMAQAAAFVLSSRWEGFGNVLVEALYCGCPVVSTDCPSGPAEILEQGRFGALVPVGDVDAVAHALAAALDAPTPRESLRARGAEFTTARTTDAYLEAVGLPLWPEPLAAGAHR